MLLKLKIENIAIIETAEIDFGSGLNVLTGETGAGKSIIIDAINAVLGERTSRELIRTGAETARVTAVFSDSGIAVNEKLLEYDIETQDDGSVLIQRSISLDGRNLCKINGCPVTVSMLKNIGVNLVNIHGQHDNQALLSQEGHYDFIDKLAENSDLLSSYRAAYSKMRALEKELDSLNIDETEKSRKLDLLNYQIDELEAACLHPGERDELTARRSLYLNSGKVIAGLREAYAAINGSEENTGAQQQLEMSANLLGSAASYYGELEKASENIRAMSYDLEEYAIEIRNALDMLDYDPVELSQIEERLDMIYRLSRKYGPDEETMLAFLDRAISEREKIVFSEKRCLELQIEADTAGNLVKTLAADLSESRRNAGAVFAENIKAELNFLDMPGVNFVVERTAVPPNANGADNIEFLISANEGEMPKPLAKIASGGELSRIMLAVKNVLSAKDDVGTLIFDEVDAGVSGRAAQKVAMKLVQVSKGRQVICVTHLAQIAAKADNHLLIKKSVSGGKTYTQVDILDNNGRKSELARIIGGLNITELQLKSAQEMLEEANKL